MFWVSIEQIQCFQALITEGSFTKASEKIHKAKSAVIYSVNNLEKQLGFPLLKRDKYRSQLTPQGRDFLIEAEKLLIQYKNLQSSCSQISSKIETRLRISVSGIYSMNKIYSVIKEAMKKYPNTEILLEREILSGEKMLFNDTVDFAIFENIHNRRELDYKQIDEVTLKLVISKDHSFLKLEKDCQNMESLFHCPQIIQRSTIPDDAYSVGVHDQAIKWKVTDTPSKKEIILNGLGWGRLPEELIKKELQQGKLVHLNWLKDDDITPIYACRKKNSYIGEVATFMWNSM